MLPPMVPTDLLDAARSVVAQGPPLLLAAIFGSAARGALRPDSDLDVAIVPVDADLPLAAELDLQAALSRATGREVDLVRLDRAPTLVRWQVARGGVVVFEKTDGEWPRFVAAAAIEHADFAESLAPAAELYRRRLAESASS